VLTLYVFCGWLFVFCDIIALKGGARLKKSKRKTPFEHLVKKLGMKYTVERTDIAVIGLPNRDEGTHRPFISFYPDSDIVAGDCIIYSAHTRYIVESATMDYWMAEPHFIKVYYSPENNQHL